MNTLLNILLVVNTIGILYYVRTIRMAAFCDEEDEENK